MSMFNENDLVVYKNEKKQIMSGGYEIKSLLLNENISAVQSDADDNLVGGSVSSIFNNFAIPAGLLMVREINKTTHYDTTHHNEMYNDSLYDKLLQHVDPSTRQLYNKRTRKVNNITNKKSRKNKI